MNAWKDWPEIGHVDVSWQFLGLIRIWSWSVDFPYFDLVKLIIFWRMHRRGGLKFGMLLHPDHLLDWLDFICSLLMFSSADIDWCRTVCRLSVHSSLRLSSTFLKSNRLSRYSYDHSDIWLECAQQYCPKSSWSRISIFASTFWILITPSRLKMIICDLPVTLSLRWCIRQWLLGLTGTEVSFKYRMSDL